MEIQILKENWGFPQKKFSCAKKVVIPKPTQNTVPLADSEVSKNRRSISEKADRVEKKIQVKATEAKRPQKILPFINEVSKKTRLIAKEADETRKKIQIKANEAKRLQPVMPSNAVLKKRRLILKDDTKEEIQKKATQFDATKKTLLDWKMIKRQIQREAARLEIEQMKNTARFNDNMDAARDFKMIIYGASYY